jgi:signal transduction histidine kinase
MAAINLRRFCTPAQLYLILAGISLITAFFNDFQVITLVANGIFVLLWGWILNWLCSKGLKAISWILVLMPFILFILTFFFAKGIISNAAHEEGFCTADDVSKIETAFSALQSSMQNRPEQSQIENALTTFKSTLDSITTEAKMNAEGFREGATGGQDCYIPDVRNGNTVCKSYATKKEANDARAARLAKEKADKEKAVQAAKDKAEADKVRDAATLEASKKKAQEMIAAEKAADEKYQKEKAANDKAAADRAAASKKK